MNFIRFVKTPRIDNPSPAKANAKKNASKKPPSHPTLSMILTITIDFSTFAGSTELAVQLVSRTNAVLSEHRIQWTDTSRELKTNLPLPPDLKDTKVVVSPLLPPTHIASNSFLSKYLGRPIEHIIGVESPRFPHKFADPTDTVFREFAINVVPFRIAEQSGETIIRHVWDAGIILSAAVTCAPISILPDELQKFIEASGISRATRILEVGTGVGILGISLAARFPQANVVVTDLEDAGLFVLHNIDNNIYNFPHLRQNISFRILDWEARPFPEWMVSDKFDLIVMADVTYNTSMFLALADALEHLSKHGAKGAKVVCCGKRRHDDEEEFWRIICERGFVIDQRTTFTMDLEGSFRYCDTGIKKDGEQVIDFILMSMS
jgi:SAM-dependent methyltransferase